MPLEVWNTIFAGATFAVIAATAVAAVVQLRHLRATNQLSSLLTIMEMWATPEMQMHMRLMRTELKERLKDPAALSAYEQPGVSRADHPEMLIADFWEQVGTIVKYDLLDEDVLFDIANATITNAWRDLAPIIAVQRRRSGPSVFENFEYIAVRARQWAAAHPNGAYPRGVPRMSDLDAAQDSKT